MKKKTKNRLTGISKYTMILLMQNPKSLILYILNVVYILLCIILCYHIINFSL